MNKNPTFLVLGNLENGRVATRFWSAKMRRPISVSLDKALVEVVSVTRRCPLDHDSWVNILSCQLECDRSDAKTLLGSLIQKEILISYKSLEHYDFGYDRAILYTVLTKFPWAYFEASERLGYATNFENPHTLEVQKGSRKHRFSFQTVVTLLPPDSLDLTRNKFKCGDWLKTNGYAVPKQIVCHLSEISNQVGHFPFPWVIKPQNGRVSANVVCNVQNHADVFFATAQIRRAKLEALAGKVFEDDLFENFLIEEYVEGATVRFFCAAGRFLSAVEIGHCIVAGDGKRPLRELIQNETWGHGHPGVLAYLNKIEKSLDTVLEFGEKLRVSDGAAPSLGAEMRKVNVPKAVRTKLSQLAVKLRLPITEIEAIVPKENGILHFDKMKFIDINPAPDFFCQLSAWQQGTFLESVVQPIVEWLMTSPQAAPLRNSTLRCKSLDQV